MSDKRRPSSWTIRKAVGAHVAATCICALFSILDRSPPGLPPAGSALGIALGVLLWASLIGWLACPLAVLVAAIREGFSRPVSYAVTAELFLCAAQTFALLPACQ